MKTKWKKNNEIVKMLKDEIRPRMNIIGEYVTSQAKLLCPVDMGNLRSSISHEEFETAQEIGTRIGTNVEYAPYLEFGTGVYAENGEGRKTPWVYFNQKLQQFVTTAGMYARPFLRPAFICSKNAIKRILGSGYSVKK